MRRSNSFRALAAIEKLRHEKPQVGFEYNGDIGYASKYADIVAHSYHPVKHITTGEGGAILTNDKELFNKV